MRPRSHTSCESRPRHPANIQFRSRGPGGVMAKKKTLSERLQSMALELAATSADARISEGDRDRHAPGQPRGRCATKLRATRRGLKPSPPPSGHDALVVDVGRWRHALQVLHRKTRLLQKLHLFQRRAEGICRGGDCIDRGVARLLGCVARVLSGGSCVRIATVLDGRSAAGKSGFPMDRGVAPSPSLIA
jgi:hypothetical protein